MDRDKVKVELKEAIENVFDSEVLNEGDFLIGDETINLMSEAALSVLLSVEDLYNYLRKEDLLK